MKNRFPKLIIAFSLFTFSFSLVKAQPTTFTAHGIGGGGAQYSPSINPANSNEIYSSTDMTDVYHSTNGGASWNVISFNQLIGGHFAMVQFTNSKYVHYCQSNNQASGNLAPVKTTDGGTTWNPITDPTGGNGSWFTIANPQDSNQVIVSDFSNLYLSNDGGKTFGSAFFTDTTSGGEGAYVAGTYFYDSAIFICTNVGIIISTNKGASWIKPKQGGITGEEFLSFAAARVGKTIRFFCITQTTGNIYVGMSGEDAGSYANVYTMTYTSPASTWTKAVNGIAAGDQPYVVTMATNNINDAYIGGANGNTSYPIILKTGNAGVSWTHVFNTTTNQNIQTGYCGSGGVMGWSWPQYVFGLDCDPNDSLIVVETDEGFIHKTIDGGKTWQALYVPPANLNPAGANTPLGKYYPSNGIEMTSDWDIVWYDSLHMLSGYTDVNATRSNDGGNSWGFNCSGLTLNTTYKFLKNPSSGVVYAATSSIHDMYQSTHLKDANDDGGNGEIMMSTDTGKTFTTMYNMAKPVIWLALDPTNANRMYASVVNHKGTGNAGGIWISNNINLGASSTWTHCPNPARTQGHPLDIHVLNDGTVVTTFSGRINPAGSFTDSSGVFISTNQGTSWTDVSAPGMKYWTMDLTVDPNDATQNTWYVCVYSGYGGAANNQGGLYRTTNRGTSWTKIVNASLNNVGDTASCFSITMDPVNKGAAYLTTESGGLFYTANVEATKPIFTQVAAYPFEQPTRAYFNPYIKNQLWVNSFGNGIEMGIVPTPSGIDQLQVNSGSVIVYPNPSKGTFTISNIEQGTSNIEVYNMLGEKVYSSVLNTGINQIVMSNEENGVYLCRVLTKDGSLVGTGKLIIQK